MKTIRSFFLAALTTALGLNAWDARAFHEFSAGVEIRAAADFYAPLGDLGAWVDVGNYGRCWHPRNVARDWRPYCDGYWAWTDCGWYWESDEPWSWACYHYGRWSYDNYYGWVWVPDVEWGPSWVSWRYGGGYCGWAPLSPRTGFGIGFDVSPSWFVFVEQSRFHERMRPSRVIVNNTTIINRTVNVTNIRRETRTFGSAGTREVYVNEGPRLAEVQRATRNRVRTEQIDRAVGRTPVPQTVLRRSQERIQQEDRRTNEQLHKQDRRAGELEHRELQRETTPQQRQQIQREREFQREQPSVRTQPLSPSQRLEPTGRPDLPRQQREEQLQREQQRQRQQQFEREQLQRQQREQQIQREQQREQRAVPPTSRPGQTPRVYRTPHDDHPQPRPNFFPPGQLKKAVQPPPAPERGRGPEKDKDKDRP